MIQLQQKKSYHSDLRQSGNLVFVYGTLKRNEGNHQYLEVVDAKFIGNAVTQQRFPLIVRGLPRLYNSPNNGCQVFGEVYSVDRSSILHVLDLLEGHPYFYKREPVKVSCDGKPIIALTYFIHTKNPHSEWMDYTCISNYTFRDHF